MNSPDNEFPLFSIEVVEPVPFQQLVESAWEQLRSGDLPAAEDLWTTALSLRSDDPAVHVGLALTLNRSQDFTSANATIENAVARFPDNVLVAANYAWIAHNQSRWEEAARRWDAYRARFPEDPIGYSAASVALRNLQHFDEADVALREGLRLHPEHAELNANFCWVAHHRGDWPEAVDRWQAFTKNFPEDPIGYSSLSVALRALRRFDEADAAVLGGLELCPDHEELTGNYAWNAYERHDWPEALRRWEGFRDQFPGKPLGHRQVMLVLSELGRFDEAVSLSRPAALRQSAQPHLATLMLEFESLGENCEFGVVQRYYGAEPLGLLRFTATPPQLLTTALLHRFDGVGEADNTTLRVHRDEYVTEDTRYHMSMHTFIRAGNEDREKRFINICRRLRFLRDKLISDLEACEKSFVYGYHDVLPDDQIRLMWDAMQRYGKNRLLFVQPTDDESAIGTTHALEPNLLIGFVDRASVETPSFEIWLSLCRKAHDFWQGADRAPHASA